MAGLPANGCSQTNRHPVEAVSDRNMGKAMRSIVCRESYRCRFLTVHFLAENSPFDRRF
jgi:hypothetical protein